MPKTGRVTPAFVAATPTGVLRYVLHELPDAKGALDAMGVMDTRSGRGFPRN